MTTSIQLPPALRAEIITYLVAQRCYDHAEQAEADNDATLLDTYNYARIQNGLPMRVFTLPGEPRPRYRDEPPVQQEAVRDWREP